MRPSPRAPVPSFLIVCSEGPSLGAGHVSRQIEIARKLQKLGHSILFLGSFSKKSQRKIRNIRNSSIVLIEGTSTQAQIREAVVQVASSLPDPWLLIDDYRIFKELGTNFSHLFPKQIHFVDGDMGWYGPALWVNSGKAQAKDADPHFAERQICGLDASVVRREIRITGLLRILVPKFLRNRVLVTFGGSDPDDLSAKYVKFHVQTKLPLLCNVVLGPAYRGSLETGDFLGGKVKVRRGPIHFYIALATCKFAIGAAGVSSFERAKIGVSSLNFVLADNQREIAKMLVDLRLAEHCDQNFDTEFANHLVSFSSNPSLIKSMEKRGKKAEIGAGPKNLISWISNYERCHK